jgi:hypothetical protein
LSKEIKRQQEYLVELQCHPGGYEGEIAELKREIRKNLVRCFAEKCRLERVISTVDDSQARLIMRLRHVSCYSWDEIAAELAVFDDEGNLLDGPSRATVRRRYRECVRKLV